jgi:hypothetical protein
MLGLNLCICARLDLTLIAQFDVAFASEHDFSRAEQAVLEKGLLAPEGKQAK